jgi:dihydrofolate synthase/folylpolyglutamate synthase
MLADKDIDGVVAAVAPRVDTWFVAPLPGPRGASAARITQALQDAGVSPQSIRTFGDVQQAFAAAQEDANEADRIAAFGSFLTVAAVLAAARSQRSGGS